MKEEFDALVEHLLANKFFLEQAIELLETRMIQGALEQCAGKQTAASKLLGIHRNTLQRKMAQYQLGNGRPRRKPAALAARARKRKAGAA